MLEAADLLLWYPSLLLRAILNGRGEPRKSREHTTESHDGLTQSLLLLYSTNINFSSYSSRRHRSSLGFHEAVVVASRLDATASTDELRRP